MRRGGRGSNLRGPWRRLDDPAIASAGYLNRGWTARNYVCVTMLAACSMAMSILIWSSRYRSNVHQLSSSGMVFPLYRYYRSGGHGMGWRENRAGRGRRIQGMDALMNIRGGRRTNFDEMEDLYIEMKLGVPPVKYNFHVDTGSDVSWVYCNIRTTVTSKLTDWGPHGLFVPEDASLLSCAGDTEDLCRHFQISSGGGEQPCDSRTNYRCIFVARYADDSDYIGLVVNESVTVAMEDKSERNLFGLFGCVISKRLREEDLLPLTDGLIGLGNCKGTLLDQWTTSKSIRQSVLGICLAKGVDWTALPSPATPVGYMSMGMDFKEKFDKSHSVWSKLANPGDAVLCSNSVNLLQLSFAGLVRDFHAAVLLDTGSDVTMLVTSVYEPILEALEVYASFGGFLRVPDSHLRVAEEQRVCWQPPDLILAKGSPIQEFEPLEFAFEGIDSASQRAAYQYLIVEPANYLIWDAITKKLCVTILQLDISVIGADMMREHLFVYDFENQRVRWQSDNCELN